MEYRNETERRVMNELMHTSAWTRKWSNMKLNISFKYSSKSTLAIFINGIHTGLFMSASSVNQDDIKEIGWEIKGKTENYINK